MNSSENIPLEHVAKAILAKHNISGSLGHVKSDGDEHLYFVNDRYVLRLTDGSTENLTKQLQQVVDLPGVPRACFVGQTDTDSGYNYILCDKLAGSDHIEAIPAMTGNQNRQLGRTVASFLDRLHAIPGKHYDIGHYVPLIPQHTGSWKDGHRRYWAYMREAAEKLPGYKTHKAVFDRAFTYMEDTQDALSFQSGPVLLHNDLHPKNIIVDNGTFSGIIDWECSQYGEADFELCHFVHWWAYPPAAGIDLKDFVLALLEQAPRCAQVPRLNERLTIYQLEHEIMQIIWRGGTVLSERLPKIASWLDGRVEQLLGSQNLG
jgi:aminoglycoside phosphotransferase (APT) family kinase protein